MTIENDIIDFLEGKEFEQVLYNMGSTETVTTFLSKDNTLITVLVDECPDDDLIESLRE